MMKRRASKRGERGKGHNRRGVPKREEEVKNLRKRDRREKVRVTQKTD